jgi:hypothetical protein
MTTDSRIGTEIAGYSIERLLGRGGMGRVYLAEDTRLGRKVALKVLDPELAEDPRFRDRFTRESRLAASLDHPNVVPIHEAGEADGVLYIAMRYVEGTDLARLIEAEGPLPLERTVSIVSQVAAALDAAHEQGLIHRDVKPGNILIGRGDHTYLTDFGLIKRREQGTALTKTGQFMGSVDYAAPEQIEGKPVDGRADVYSLGCVLYQCLVGEPSYPRDTEVAVMYAHLNDRVPRPTLKRQELPPAVDAVVAKAMAKQPAERYETAQTLAGAARGALERPVVPEPEKRRPVPRWLIPAAVALVALAALTAFLATRGGSQAQHVASSPKARASAAQSGPPIGSLIYWDAATGRVVTTTSDLPSLANPCGGVAVPAIAVGEGGVWLMSSTILVHLDEESGKIVGTRQVTGGNGGCSSNSLAVGDRAVWITQTSGGQVVTRLDPSTDDNLHPVRLAPRYAVSVTVGAGAVWVATGDGNVIRLQSDTGRVRDTTPVAKSLDAILFGGGYVWAVDTLGGLIYRLDPATEKVDGPVKVSGSIDGISAGVGALWILNSYAGTIASVDASSDVLGPASPVGPKTSGISVGLGNIWVSAWNGTLYRIDPVTRDAEKIAIHSPMAAVAVDQRANRVWAAVEPEYGP